MIDDDLDGPRLGELFLAEIVGREYGGLDELTITELDEPLQFSCSIGDRYELNRQGQRVGDIEIEAQQLTIDVFDGEHIAIDAGGAIKPAIEAVLERTAPQ